MSGPAHGGALHALAAVLLWSTVASAFKLSLRELSPPQLVFASSLVSAAFLGTVLALQGRLPELLTLPRRQWLRSAGLGLLNPCLYYLVLLGAYHRLPAQQAQALNYTWALVLAYLSALLLRQRLLRTDVLAGFICYGGALVVATRGHLLELRFDDGLGVALALGSTLIWGLYWVGITRDPVDAATRLFLNFLLGLPWAALVCGLAADFNFGWKGWAGAAYVGLFEMGLTFLLWLAALRRAGNASRVANLIFLSPFLSLVFLHHLVGERIEPATLVGLAVIVGGLLIQRRGAARGRSRAQAGE